MKLLALVTTALLAAAPAQAAILTYKLAGTFEDGTTFTGQLALDDTQPLGPDLLLDRTFATVSGLGTSNDIGGRVAAEISPGMSIYGFDYELDSPTAPYLLRVRFNAITENRALRFIPNGALRSGELGRIGSLTDLVSGTITLAAVPEPATWAMMIAGFGLAGAALRRSRRHAPRYA